MKGEAGNKEGGNGSRITSEWLQWFLVPPLECGREVPNKELLIPSATDGISRPGFMGCGSKSTDPARLERAGLLLVLAWIKITGAE